MEKVLKNRYKFYVSSWHCKQDDANAVGVKEKILEEYEDGTTEVLDHLNILEDPIRPFWVTKEEFRNHDYKKEFEDEDKLDKYTCHDSQLETMIERVLNLKHSFRRRTLRQICDSPYVYGADIDTETLIKQWYANHEPIGKKPGFSRGGLDIEAEVRDEKRINIITFIHEHKVYTCALREYCRIDLGNEEFKMASEEDCLKVIHELLGFYFDKHHFELVFSIQDTELDLIRWTFDRIHECKTDYISIWNMGFDIPKIIERIEALGEDPSSILCHPDVPYKYRFVDWYEDKSSVAHFTDKWHWCTIAGYSQFIDGMCLYARLRKVYGRDSSYSLDDISTKELGHGKLHFGNITNHWYMQHYRFLEYIAYNINDVMIMQLMEWKNNDQVAMTSLIPMSLPRQFARQTVIVRNDAYNYGRERHRIVASAGTSMFTDYDKMQIKAGGTVLPPNKAIGVGIDAVEEFPRKTQVAVHVNDLDEDIRPLI